MVDKQMKVLFQLIQGNEGKIWSSDKVGWNLETPACQWLGIECDRNGNVVAILITETEFPGTLPPSLGTLTTLQSIRMARNKVHGKIPPSLASLPNLEDIDLSENRLTGTIHEFNSIFIRTLRLGHNDFHSSIPENFIVAKETFMELSIAHNRLSGSIPLSLSQLTKLDTIDLSNNMLHGILPKFDNHLLLQQLYLNNNNFVGSIPSTIATNHPSTGDLLEKVHLQDNALSGGIPIQLADMSKLKELMIHDNKLTGQIPQDLCTADLNSFFFPPSLASTLVVDKDYCDAIACPINTISQDGSYPCTTCGNLHYNPYIGQTRQCNTFVTQRDILKKFYESTSTGKNNGWNGINNWNDEEVFLCDFTGITCDNNFYVTEIILKNRGLKGTIPIEIGFLPYLEKIDVSDNELTGYLPSDLRWCPLKEIDISGNKIRGIVPPKLCLMEGLNDNGFKGDYNCDHIACPAGTYSPSGRKDPKHYQSCTKCSHNNDNGVIGYRHCRELGIASGLFGILVVLFTLIVAITVLAVLRMKRKRDFVNPCVTKRGTNTWTSKNHQPYERVQDNNMGSSLQDIEIVVQQSKLSDQNTYIMSKTHGGDRDPYSASFTIRSAGEVGRNYDDSSSRDLWLDVPKI